MKKKKKLIFNEDTKIIESYKRKNVKKILKRNLIYIQTFTALLSFIISLIGIFLNFRSVNIQKTVSEIQKLQFEIQHKTNLPVFVVSYQLHDDSYDVNGKVYDPGIECTIKNIGGSVSNLVINPYYYYTIHVAPLDENEKIKNDSIIERDYSNSRKFDVCVDGIIINEMPYYNVKESEFKINLINSTEIDDILMEMSDEMHKLLRNYIFIDPTLGFQVEYVDIFGEYHNECYALSRSQVKSIDQPNINVHNRVEVNVSNIKDSCIEIIKMLKGQDLDKFIKLCEG